MQVKRIGGELRISVNLNCCIFLFDVRHSCSGDSWGGSVKRLSVRCVMSCLRSSGPVVTPYVSSLQDRDGFGGPVGPRGRGRGRGDWSMGAPGGLQEVTYTIPADKCGLVIGKGEKCIFWI